GAGTCQIQVPTPTSSHSAKPIGSGRCPPFLPPRSLLGHVTGPRRLQDYSGSAVLLPHAQWVPSCEAASYHSRVPTLKMPAPKERRRPVKGAVGGNTA
ncbi:unnamed protein product, partial [Staurois parvus]